MKRLIIQVCDFLIRKNVVLTLFILKYWHTKKNVPKLKNLNNQITIINTFDNGGGASKIARQLTEFLQQDFSIRLYVKNKRSNKDWVNEIYQKTYSFIEEVLRREAIKKGWIEFSGFHALNLLKDPFFLSTKIVHIHNLHGEFFSPALFSSVLKGKKVIWTLHDESFITGHCSCTLGCERWKVGCGGCPDLSIYPPVNYDNTDKVLFFKKKWIIDLQPIVICPSEWLAKRVREAYPALNNVEVIPNGVDVTQFYPRNKKQIRLELGLPLDKKVVLFVAEFSTNNPFKGGAILRELVSEEEFKEIVFVTVGGKQETNFSNLLSLPYISNESELSKLYSACDVLLYPTQADNLPLVVLESMACGTPVIASNVGGIPEIINDTNGFLIADYKSKKEFKKELVHFLSLTNLEIEKIANNALSTIKLKYTLNQMISMYQCLYKS